jgi:hypothetical protein
MPIRVLYLACNPPGTTRLDLEREIAAVEARIRAGAYRDTVRLIPALAANTDDLQRAILDNKPSIIHFSGHGQGGGGLVLRGPDQAPKPVSAQALTKLFALYREQLREQFQTELSGVVLNACDSAPLAQKVGRVVGGAIGMRGAISDPSAISFAATLYQGLSFGCTLRLS